MRNLIFLLSLSAMLVSCYKDINITVIDENGQTYQAGVAPVMQNQLPTIGEKIPIMEPRGFPLEGMGYVYNSNDWQMSDTSGAFGVKRNIVFGEVVSVR